MAALTSVEVPRSELENLPPHLVLSKVTAAMWSAGIAEADMEHYCQDVAGLTGDALLEATTRWVTVA